MPSAMYAEPPAIPKWQRSDKTSESLDWADIKMIDLSIFDEPGGKQRLAEDLRDAVRYVTIQIREDLTLAFRSITPVSSV